MAMFDGGEGYQSPYDSSYYYDPTGGTDADFVAYLKRLQAERQGGILGGGMFGRMGEAEKKAVNANDVLGELIQKRRGEYDPNQGGSDSDAYAAMQAAQSKGASLEDMVRAKSGQDFDPLQLAALFGSAGGLFAGIGGWARDSEIGRRLAELGYSEEQIDYMLSNSGALMSELGINPEAGFKKDIDYQALRDGGGFSNNLLQSLFGSDSGPAPEGLDPFAMGRIGQGSNVASMNPITKVGALNDGRLFSVVDPKALESAEAARVAEAEAARRIAIAAQAAANAEAGRSYTDSYAPDSVRSSGDSYTVSNSNTGYSANFSSSPSFGSGTFDTSGTFGD